jgi:DNA-binding MarR family transcriptional regulator
LDIKGVHSYTVEPPSVNPKGELYLFDNNYNGIYTLSPGEFPFPEWLEEWKPKVIQINPDDETLYPDMDFFGLGDRARRILAGDPEVLKTFPSRNEAEMNVIVRAVSLGWTMEHVIELFEIAWAGAKGRERGANWIREQYAAAVEYWKRKASGFDSKINRIMAKIVEKNPYTGRGRFYTVSVVLAVLQIAREAGPSRAGWLHLAERRVAELAGVTRQAVNTILKTLPMRLVMKDKADWAAAWDIRPMLEELGMGLGEDTSKTIQRVEWVSSDVQRYGAAGKTPILETLEPGISRTASEWAECWNLKRMTADRRLDALEAVGLIRAAKELNPKRRPRIFYEAVRKPTAADVIALAEYFGTAGEGARQKERHEEERQQQAGFWATKKRRSRHQAG